MSMSSLRIPSRSYAAPNCPRIPIDLSKHKRLSLTGLALAAAVLMLPLGGLSQTTASSMAGTVVDPATGICAKRHGDGDESGAEFDQPGQHRQQGAFRLSGSAARTL